MRENKLSSRFYRLLIFSTINLVPFPVAFLTVGITIKGSIASSASFQIWTTFSTCRACLEDRRWNAFGLVSKYVISLTFFTAVFGNFAQFGKSRHLDTENVNVYILPQ
jgi:hypothetical protein